jgi:hypothetical protein
MRKETAVSDTRIVLVKPGDLLVIGNVGALYEDEQDPDLTPLTTIKEALGLAGVVVFEGDIDLAAVTPHAVEQVDYGKPQAAPDAHVE